MQFTAAELAALLQGEIVGNPTVTVDRFSKIEEGQPGSLSFLSNPKYTPYLYTTQASIVLVNLDFIPEKPIQSTLIKVRNSYDAMGRLLEMVQKTVPVKSGIENPSFLASSARLGQSVYIGAFAYVADNVVLGNNVKIYPHCWIGENSIIEDDAVIFPGVKIYPDTRIGKRCVLHAGVVVGSDGFGFVRQDDGTYRKLPQTGNVVIEDDVEIGANTTIDCATMGSTFIRKGVKLDNLVQIGHNCEINENSVLAALTGIAGSSVIGKNCTVAGQVGVAGHLKVGDGVILAAKTGVTTNIPENSIQMGIYSFEASKYRKSHAAFKNLPDLVTEVRQLKRELQILKNQNID